MRVDAVKVIKERLTMRDMLQFYGLSTNKAGFMCCPFHKEKTASLKVYAGNRGWHCFGCGENGDVISFVQKLFNLNFRDTLLRIDADFSLSLFEKPTLAQYRENQKHAKALKDRIEAEKKEVDEAEAKYWEAYDELIRLQNIIDDFAPSSENDEINPAYAEAVRQMAYQEYVVECANIERWRLKHDRGKHPNNGNQ